MLVEFLKLAFDATGDFRTDSPSVMRIGDSLVMVSGVGPREALPAFLYLYVDDIEATYRRAMEASAVSLENHGTRSMAIGAGWSRIRAEHLANRNAQRIAPVIVSSGQMISFDV